MTHSTGTQELDDRLAAYLLDLARQGRGCPGSPNSLASALGVSPDAASKARTRLYRSGRLKGWDAKYTSIDGVPFGSLPEKDEVETVKTRLRILTGQPVFDARTAAEPERVPRGVPDRLCVGGRVVSWHQALEMLDTRRMAMVSP